MNWIELKSVCFTHTEYVYRESITFHIDLVFASQTLFSNHKETYLTPACINWIYGMIMSDFVVGYKNWTWNLLQLWSPKPPILQHCCSWCLNVCSYSGMLYRQIKSILHLNAPPILIVMHFFCCPLPYHARFRSNCSPFPNVIFRFISPLSFSIWPHFVFHYTVFRFVYLVCLGVFRMLYINYCNNFNK